MSSILFLGAWQALASEPRFSYTLFQEPTTLDPQMLSSASGNYIITVIYRGLYRWNMKEGLVPDEGQCVWQNRNLKLTCTISDEARWSDGTKVTAKDYLRTFRFLVDPANGAPMAQSLMSILNAEEIYKGKKEPESLGVSILGENGFSISFKTLDSEFLYKMLHPALYPRHKSFTRRFKPSKTPPISNHAFKIVKWKSESWFDLARNPHFKIEGKNLVKNLRALIIDSDVTALQLFEAQKIQLVRRLPSQEFARFQNKKGFFKLPVLRFDYVGFGPQLKPFAKLRAAMAESFYPEQFQTLFQTDGRPGCPSIPSEFYSGSVCRKTNTKPRQLAWPKSVKRYFGFSEMGGDDIQRAAEWFQAQWKNHLKITMELHSREQKSYISWLKTDPPAVFRKGVSLDRPTCLAALETFAHGSLENYIQLNNSKFEKIIKELSQTFEEQKKKQLCTKGLEILIAGSLIIPTGEMYFAGLSDPKYSGWKLNELNQLDLRHLTYNPTVD